MKRQKIFTKIVPLMFLLIVSTAAGSYISFVTTISSEKILENSTKVSVELQQRGDESAYKIEVVPFSSDYFRYEGRVGTERLDPGKTLSGKFELELKREIKLGNYPFFVRTVYHDANMYPFSVVSPHSIEYLETYESTVKGSMNSIEIANDGSGEISLKVRNLEEKPKEVLIRLYLPEELKTDETEKTLQIGPGEEKEIKYRVESKGALPGSSYAAWVSIEYETDRHYTTFSSGLVKIVEKKENFNLIWILAALFIALFAIFIYLKCSVRGVKHDK